LYQLPFDVPYSASLEEVCKYEEENESEFRSSQKFYNPNGEWENYCESLKNEVRPDIFKQESEYMKLKDPAWHGEDGPIEAVFEYLRLENVKKVVQYKGLKPKGR
jgi:hypothetical protein